MSASPVASMELPGSRRFADDDHLGHTAELSEVLDDPFIQYAQGFGVSVLVYGNAAAAEREDIANIAPGPETGCSTL